MAIAFRAAGARLKADIGTSGQPNQTVALPAGHASGDFLLLFVLSDDNTNLVSGPAGWNLLLSTSPSTATQQPYNAPARLRVYTRTDTGSLGSTVALAYSTATWPAGAPWTIAFTVAYSGVDASGPIERWSFNSVTSTTAAQAHPAVSTMTTGDWLLTFRATSAFANGTFTSSVGGDTERVDDSDGFGELSCTLYDSGAPVSTGAQTVRTTTFSRPADYGSTLMSIVLKPPSAAGSASAAPGNAGVTATAYDAGVDTQAGPWDLCGAGLPDYRFTIDWDDPAADVTGDIVSEITTAYGRDQERQLSQASVGSAAFTLTNAERTYSPENTSSPFYGDLDPARVMRGEVVWSGQTYPLFTGRIDDYTVKTDFGDRTVDLTFLDGLSDLSGVDLSTPVYTTMRTGELIGAVLDEAGWTGGRDLDTGATVVPYWWADGTTAFTAVNDLVRSEGPPAVAYVAPDGTFVFRDRHHRLQRPASRVAQATLHAGTLGECTGTGVPEGALSLARPFTYAHGWKDIVNSVTFDVPVRVPAAELTAVWSDTSTYTLALGQSLDLTVSSSDAFTDAVTPVPGTDILYTGAGVLGVLLSRTSGASARLTLQAIGGAVTITSVQVLGRLIAAQQTVRVSAQDPGSITLHGERAYGADAPWASPEDAAAIADMVLLHYAQRRPTVQLRLVSSDPAHYAAVLARTVSDRVRVVNGEMGLDDDFFIEHVAHTVQRTGVTGRPPVHSVVLGCEKDQTATINPFTFDLRGAGFDQGQFDRPSADDPDAVFLFDDPVQGRFDQGVLGT